MARHLSGITMQRLLPAKARDVTVGEPNALLCTLLRLVLGYDKCATKEVLL